MNQINNSYSSHGQPFSAAALSFLQNAWLSGFAGVGEAIIGPSYNTSTVYVLYGCTGTLSGGHTDYAEGYMFYNGEMFYCPPQPGVVNPSGSNVFICNMLLTNYDDSAGTSFVDGLVQPIRQIRNIQISTGASGSGSLSGTIASDYNHLVFLNNIQTINQLIENQTGGMAAAFGAGAYIPVIMSGLVLTMGSSTYSITPGWFFYNGQYVYSDGTGGGVIPNPIFPNVILFTITIVDGLPIATVSNGSAMTSSTIFPQHSMQSWSKSVGIDDLETRVSTLEMFVEDTWTSGAPLTYAGATGGGSVSLTGATIVNNNYKVVGRTFFWQLQVRNATATGTVHTFSFQTPFGFYASGVSWVNTGGLLPTVATGASYSAPPYITLITGLGQPFIQFAISDGSAFPTGAGALNFDVNIVAEMQG